MGKQIDLKALLESKVGNIEPMDGAKTAIERAEISIPKNLMFDAESSEFKPETKPVTVLGARGLTVEDAKQFDDEMNRFVRLCEIIRKSKEENPFAFCFFDDTAIVYRFEWLVNYKETIIRAGLYS